MRSSFLSFLLPTALALPATKSPRADKPLYWLLAGDSTTAPQAANGGGWGDGFLSTTLAGGSSGHNYGHNGATTLSFRNGGDWAQVTSDIAEYKSDYDVYVTIQFGHNDQKSGSGVSVEDYKTNLARFASEASNAGATPILVTPLTRRQFTDDGTVKSNLAEQRTATIDVAESNGIRWIDLNQRSEEYVNAIGKEAAMEYNLNPDDTTHLKDWGSVVFGRMVSDLLVAKYPEEIEEWTKKNETLSATIAANEPA